MSNERTSIPFDEFTTDPARFFDQVLRDHETVIVKKAEGELVALKPVVTTKMRRRKKTRANYEAFYASAGGWRDVDIGAFLRQAREGRAMSPRPPVKL
jgi:hypothetical protein